MSQTTNKKTKRRCKSIMIPSCVLLSGIFFLPRGYALEKPVFQTWNHGILFAQAGKAQNKDNELIENYMKSKANSPYISFDASNIKQFWIDKSVSAQNGNINILLNKSKDTFESIPLKIQLANVDKTQDCRVDIITDSPDIDFSVVNSKSKVLSTKTEQDTFIQYTITSASFHLEESDSFSFNLKMSSKKSDIARIKGIYLSFERNGNYLASPGKINFTKNNTRFEGAKNNINNLDAIEVTGKNSRVISNHKICTSNNTFDISVKVKNIGKTPTKISVGFIPYTKNGVKLDLTNYPYNDINNVLKVISSNKEKGTIVVDKNPVWSKGCYLSLNAKEDLSDVPSTTLVNGTIAAIKKLEDGHAEITMSAPLNDSMKEGTCLRVNGIWRPYLYTNEKVLNPGEEEVFSGTIKHDDNFLRFSNEAISRGVSYVVPVVLSYSVDPKEENTVEVSDFKVSY